MSLQGSSSFSRSRIVLQVTAIYVIQQPTERSSGAMMTAQGSSSSLGYESLPTEDGGAPRSSLYRDSSPPLATHHPIPRVANNNSYQCGQLITATLVVFLLTAAVFVGIMVGRSARLVSMQEVWGGAVGYTTPRNSYWGYEDDDKTEAVTRGNYSSTTPDNAIGQVIMKIARVIILFFCLKHHLKSSVE